MSQFIVSILIYVDCVHFISVYELTFVIWAQKSLDYLIASNSYNGIPVCMHNCRVGVQYISFNVYPCVIFPIMLSKFS